MGLKLNGTNYNINIILMFIIHNIFYLSFINYKNTPENYLNFFRFFFNLLGKKETKMGN